MRRVEIQGRYMRRVEIQGRYMRRVVVGQYRADVRERDRRDNGEIQGGYRGDLGEIYGERRGDRCGAWCSPSTVAADLDRCAWRGRCVG